MTLFHWFNSLAGRNHVLDVVTAAITQYAPFVFIGLFAIYFLMDPAETSRMRRSVLLAGLSGVLAVLLSVVIGSLVYRARPFLFLPPEQVHLLIPHSPESSFPSDHAAGSAAFAFGMWRSPDRSARWIFSVTALLVGVSRLVAGVHWPTDILASFALGGLSAQVIFALDRPLSPLLTWVLRLFERAQRRFRR
jgi:undecaprenyl-diphosphatase